MVDLTVLPGFVAAVVLILIAPGPDMAYMVAVGLEGGRKAAVRAIFGICSGMSLYAVAVVAGLGALVGSHPWLLTGVKIFGVVYLLWLGIGAARSAKRSVESTQGFVAGRWYLRGVLVSLTNPKIILFFLAFLPQFIGQAQSPALQMALLGGVDVLIELIIYGAVGLFAGVFHMRFAGNRKALCRESQGYCTAQLHRLRCLYPASRRRDRRTCLTVKALVLGRTQAKWLVRSKAA